MVFVDMDGNPIDMDPNEIILIPEKIPVRVFVQGGPGGGVGDQGEGISTFQKLKENVLDDPVHGNAADIFMRNKLRLSYWNEIQKFGALESLLGKNLIFLQLVLIDDNRDIQGKLYQGLNRQNPEDPDVAENSRKVFKVLIPHLLQDTECWVISRSLVIKEYNRALLDEALLKFLPYDPVGGLKDIPFDVPLGTPDSEVSRQNASLMAKVVKEYKDTPVPLGIHCTEVFMFIAGDFALDNDGGLNSRKAVEKFLCHLNTEEGLQKIHGFDEMAAGCPKVSPEKIVVLKDMHVTA